MFSTETRKQTILYTVHMAYISTEIQSYIYRDLGFNVYLSFLFFKSIMSQILNKVYLCVLQKYWNILYKIKSRSALMG